MGRDPRLEEEANGHDPEPLRTLAREVWQLRHELPGMVARLERVEHATAVTGQRLEDLFQRVQRMMLPPLTLPPAKRGERRESPYPPSAEVTQAGTRVVMPAQDAIELQRLASRIRWWRGTARDVALGALRTAGKLLVTGAVGWALHILWELLHRS